MNGSCWILFVDFFSQSETFNGRDIVSSAIFFRKCKTIAPAMPAIVLPQIWVS
jgi:hypothetical protein